MNDELSKLYENVLEANRKASEAFSRALARLKTEELPILCTCGREIPSETYQCLCGRFKRDREIDRRLSVLEMWTNGFDRRLTALERKLPYQDPPIIFRRPLT